MTEKVTLNFCTYKFSVTKALIIAGLFFKSMVYYLNEDSSTPWVMHCLICYWYGDFKTVCTDSGVVALKIANG